MRVKNKRLTNSQEHEKQSKERKARDFYPTTCQSKLCCSNKNHGVGTGIEDPFMVKDRVQKHIYNIIFDKTDIAYQWQKDVRSFNKQH